MLEHVEPPSLDLPQWVPSPVAVVLEPLLSPWVLLTVSAASALVIALSLVGVSWIARRLPADYLLSDAPTPPARGAALVGHIARNLLGTLLLLLGLAMLFLPGQGLLTMVVGLVVMDFPGKRALERRLLRIPRVLRAINRLRARSGRPPLRVHPPAPKVSSDRE